MISGDERGFLIELLKKLLDDEKDNRIKRYARGLLLALLGM